MTNLTRSAANNENAFAEWQRDVEPCITLLGRNDLVRGLTV